MNPTLSTNDTTGAVPAASNLGPTLTLIKNIMQDGQWRSVDQISRELNQQRTKSITKDTLARQLRNLRAETGAVELQRNGNTFEYRLAA